MTEIFKAYLQGLTSVEMINRNAITTTMYIDQDPLNQHENIIALKEHAIKFGMTAESFDLLHKTEVEKVYEGQKERIEKGFVPFVPFVTIEAKKLSPFPIDCLPDQIKPFVLEVSESIQAPIDMAAVEALTVAAVCVQGKYIINPKPGYIEPLNLYVLIVAPPSERKSPTLKELTSILMQYQKEENERRAADVQAYRSEKKILTERIESQIKSASKKKGIVSMDDVREAQEELRELEKNAVSPLRLIADNITQEALISLMADNNGRMAIISAEGGIFDIMAGLYKQSVDIDVFTKAYTGEMIMIDRKGRAAETVDHATLTMLLMAQPIVLESLTGNKTFDGKGLTARFLYSIPQSIVGERDYETQSIQSVSKEAFELLMRDLLGVKDTGTARILKLSDEAHLEAKKFFEELEPRLVGDLEELGGWAGKLHGQTMRIAGILHCCRWGSDAEFNPVDAETIKKARKISEYFLEHTKAAFDVLGISETEEEKMAKYILKRFQSRNVMEMSKRDLFRLCQNKNGFESVDDFEDVLDILVQRGYFSIEIITTSGRPSEKIHLNPLVTKGTKGTKVDQEEQSLWDSI